MLFKVGDKVVKANGEEWTSGEEYKLIMETNFSGNKYGLSTSIGWWDEKELKLYEEDKEVKELTFKEVIANIKEGEVWDDGFLKIEMISNSISIGSLNGKPFENIIAFVINPCRKFKLQRKEYTFEEAYKARKEGKEIESLVTSIKYNNKQSCYISTNEIDGKWYIND